jgi:hypothetical protein
MFVLLGLLMNLHYQDLMMQDFLIQLLKAVNQLLQLMKHN